MSEEEHGTWISRKELLELKALAQDYLTRIQELEAENDKLYKAFSYSQDLNRSKGVELADAICRILQLEKALEELRGSFEVRMKRATKLVDEGELNDYWRGNRAALEVCLCKLATLSSEAPQAKPEEEGE